MPALFVFLLKVNIALLIFCLGYYLVLRKLTFYTLNRVYLVLAIVLSSVYPAINFTDFVQRHHELAAPVQKVALNWQVPVMQFTEQPTYWYWAGIVFWLGVVVFATRLAMQLLSLYRLYLNSKPGNIKDHEVRITTADVSPFSFWQNIYINPDNVDAKDLKSILQHEQVHVTEWHTLDVLLAEISVIFYWFNPGVWLMKKAVRENIEFITDRKILQKGMDSKAYQYSLLNVSVAAAASAGITNHFNFSTLKKRIKMMNAKRSSNVTLTRYAFLLPTVLICLFVFSISKAELVRNGKVAYKNISASVNNLVAIPYLKPTAVDEESVVEHIDTNKKPTKIVTVRFKRDTGFVKNFTYTISSGGHGDTTAYYINGEKVSEEDFKKLKTNQPEEIRLDDNPDGTATTEYSIRTTMADSTKQATVVYMAPFTKLSKGTAYQRVILTPAAQPVNATYTAMVTSARPTKIYFKDKVILIDGKEADVKALRKLSPLDIESITPVNVENYTGNVDDYVEKYGEKAQNGMIYIVTKKSKE